METEKDFLEIINSFWKKIKDLHLGLAQNDNYIFFNILEEYFGQINIIEFDSDEELNGWKIPWDWKIKNAYILDSTKKKYSLDSRFGLPYLAHSDNFVIETASDPKIFTSNSKSAIPWNCSGSYTPQVNKKGICISRELLENLNFPIEIFSETEFSKSKMLVGEIEVNNERNISTVFFNAHTCHPGQFNDALIGILTISHLIKSLNERKSTLKFNYKGVFAPEHIGSVFYLNHLKQNGFDFQENKHASLYTEMTALRNPISLQESLMGNSVLDKIFKYLLNLKGQYKIGVFRSIVGNDETVWESSGFEVPCISISRLNSRNYFEAYHTNEDTLENANLQSAWEVYQLIYDGINILELDVIPKIQFEGLFCLSNPNYNLYTKWPDPTIDNNYSNFDLNKFAILQDILPRFMNGKYSCLELAMAIDISFYDLYDYLVSWKNKGLIVFDKIINLNFYNKKSDYMLNHLKLIINSNDFK